MPRFGEESYSGRAPQIANFYQDYGQGESLRQQQEQANQRLQLIQRGGAQRAAGTRENWAGLANIVDRGVEGYQAGKEEGRKAKREARSEEEHVQNMETNRLNQERAKQAMEAGNIELGQKKQENEYYYGAPGASEEANAATFRGPPSKLMAGGPRRARFETEHEKGLARQEAQDTLNAKSVNAGINANYRAGQLSDFQLATAKTDAEKTRIAAVRQGAATMFANADALKKQNPYDPQALMLEQQAEDKLKAANFSPADIAQVRTADAKTIGLQNLGSQSLVYGTLPEQGQAAATLDDVRAKTVQLQQLASAIQDYDTTPGAFPNDTARARGVVFASARAAGMQDDIAAAEQGAWAKTPQYQKVLASKISAELARVSQGKEQALRAGNQQLAAAFADAERDLGQLMPAGQAGGIALGGVIRAPVPSYRGGPAQNEQVPAAGSSNANFMGQGQNSPMIPPGRPANVSVPDWVKQNNQPAPAPRPAPNPGRRQAPGAQG